MQLIKRGNQFININLFWAFAYNVIMMPIVAGVFYGYGITMSPVWSSLAMSCSSIIVVVFSHFLSFFKYNYEDNLKVNTTLTDSEPSQVRTNEKYLELSESINEWSIYDMIDIIIFLSIMPPLQQHPCSCWWSFLIGCCTEPSLISSCLGYLLGCPSCPSYLYPCLQFLFWS